jgi:hypothetical protein
MQTVTYGEPTTGGPDLDLPGETPQVQDNVPRQWREGVARIQHHPTPPGVAQHLWEVFLNDCSAFLNSPDNWAARASSLGWNVLHVFGCNASRPSAYGVAGLVWRINGGKIIQIHLDWAKIVLVGGAEKVIHRRRPSIGVTLPWRLRMPNAGNLVKEGGDSRSDGASRELEPAVWMPF